MIRPGAASLYDPSTQRWSLLPTAPFGCSSGQPVWTGRQILIYCPQFGAKRPSTAGLVYTPRLVSSAAPVEIQLVLDRTEVTAGTPLRGEALLTNTTGRTITVETCAADGWLSVGLTNHEVSSIPLSPAIACAPTVRLSPGLNRFPITISSDFRAVRRRAVRRLHSSRSVHPRESRPCPPGSTSPRSSSPVFQRGPSCPRRSRSRSCPPERKGRGRGGFRRELTSPCGGLLEADVRFRRRPCRQPHRRSPSMCSQARPDGPGRPGRLGWPRRDVPYRARNDHSPTRKDCAGFHSLRQLLPHSPSTLERSARRRYFYHLAQEHADQRRQNCGETGVQPPCIPDVEV